MKTIEIIILIVALLVIATLIGCSEDTTTGPEENDPPTDNAVSGTWSLAESPYQIDGDITIPDGETLTIKPGVEVIFTGHYKLNVKGRLLAVGTKQDTIKFTAKDKHIGWHGIKLQNISSTNDSSIFEYCMFQYGKANTGSGRENRSGGAISTNLNKLRISHCLFQNNLSFASSRDQGAGGAIAIGEGDPIIEYCEFRGNESVYGSAMVIAGNSTNALIRNNHFHHNNGHGTINMVLGATPILINNVIEYNHSDEHGIVHFGGDAGRAVLINNTIVNNSCMGGGAVFVYLSLPPLFINNIIYGNQPAQVYLEASSGLDFISCLIEGGKSGITGARFTGTYQNCLDSNPLFVSSNDYHLQNTSPCIGAGTDAVEINATSYCCPHADIEGNPRPYPIGSKPDIGAFESE